MEIARLYFNDLTSNDVFYIETAYYYISQVFQKLIPKELQRPDPLLVWAIPQIRQKRSWGTHKPWGVFHHDEKHYQVYSHEDSTKPDIIFRHHIKTAPYYDHLIILPTLRLNHYKLRYNLAYQLYIEWLDTYHKDKPQYVPFVSLNMLLWEIVGHEYLHFILKHDHLTRSETMTDKQVKAIVEKAEKEVQIAFINYFIYPITDKTQWARRLQIKNFISWLVEARSHLFD
jgi:hypothetical protein